MNTPPDVAPPVPRWLHAWAVLTVCVALPLILLGAEVTTKQVGMADQQALRTPWYLFTLSWEEMLRQGPGLIIEHSHRTFGWLVGVCAIVLAVGMARTVRRPLLRWAGCATLALVVCQGVLGYARVKYNAPLGPELKLFHGLFSQIALAGMVGVALLTSRAGQRTAPAVPELRRLSVAVMLILYLQIAFGGVVRHFLHPHAQRAHVLFAFVAAGAVLWLVRSVWEKTTDASVRRGAGLLAGLVVVQLALGVEAWLGRFGAGVSPLLVGPNFYVDAVRTGHFVVGAALFQTAVALTLLLYRPETAAVVARVRTADVVETNRPAGLEWGGVA